MTTNQIYNQEAEKVEGEFWQSDHIRCMWTALDGGDDSEKTTEANGEGTIHIYKFKDKESAPKFQCVSDDIWNQIRIQIK